MIKWETVENFVLSKAALLTGSIIVIIALAKTVNNRDVTIREERAQNKSDLFKKDSIIAKRDSTIYDCKQQQKITADAATKSAQMQADEYKGLWLEYVHIKTEAQRKNIIE